MRLERANYIREGGWNYDGKGQVRGVEFRFAQQTHVLVLIFSDMCMLGSFCATAMEDSGSLMPPPI
jgi:hypothetical protein